VKDAIFVERIDALWPYRTDPNPTFPVCFWLQATYEEGEEHSLPTDGLRTLPGRRDEEAAGERRSGETLTTLGLFDLGLRDAVTFPISGL
jgi:hypothetical protein